MSDDYTPTTEEVLEAWITGNQLPHYEIGDPNDALSTEELTAQFYRWYGG